MKQPDLGKKISELRKAKGLTQEELVEKCNVSVRTIQRIEAGEVDPRLYTIKVIFAALESDFKEVTSGSTGYLDGIDSWLMKLFFFKDDKTSNLNYVIRQLTLAGVFAIIYFALRFFEGLVEYFRFTEDEYFNTTVYSIVKICVLIAFIMTQRGFIVIGALFDNRLLRVASTLLIFAGIVVIGFDLIALHVSKLPLELTGVLYGVLFGAGGFVFGIALINLRPSLGRMSLAAGSLEIVAACFSLTIILSMIGPFILIPAELLEVLLLFRAAGSVRKLRK